MAWAVAEGLALLGGVVCLLTARPAFHLFGTLVLLAAFLIVPVPSAGDAAGRSGTHA